MQVATRGACRRVPPVLVAPHTTLLDFMVMYAAESIACFNPGLCTGELLAGGGADGALRFVMKGSLRRAPVVGSAAEIMDCVFVEAHSTPVESGRTLQASNEEEISIAAGGTSASRLEREAIAGAAFCTAAAGHGVHSLKTPDKLARGSRLSNADAQAIESGYGAECPLLPAATATPTTVLTGHATPTRPARVGAFPALRAAIAATDELQRARRRQGAFTAATQRTLDQSGGIADGVIPAARAAPSAWSVVAHTDDEGEGEEVPVASCCGLNSGRNWGPGRVMVFAEGTTSNGTAVTAFRSGAFAAAGVGRALQPVGIRWAHAGTRATQCCTREPRMPRFGDDISVPEEGDAADEGETADAMGQGWMSTSWESIPARTYVLRLLSLPPTLPRMVLPSCPPHPVLLSPAVMVLWFGLHLLVELLSLVLHLLISWIFLAPRAVQVVFGEPVVVESDTDVAGAMQRCREACARLSDLPLADAGAADKWALHKHILSGRSDWKWWVS